MIGTLVMATLLSAPQAPLRAEEFFPLVPGTRFTYEDTGAGTATTVDEVGRPIEIEGLQAIPVVTNQRGQQATTYYRIDGNTVVVVAYSSSRLLAAPMPLFQVGTGRQQWEYQGLTDSVKQPEPILIRGEARLIGTRTYFGKRAEVLEVKIDARVGAVAPEQQQQVALYARGIGLVEMSTISRVGNSSITRKLRLIKVEPPSGDGA
jgi:hypothetical protein